MNVIKRLIFDRKNLLDEIFPKRTVKSWKEIKRIYHKKETVQRMNVALYCATKVPIMDMVEIDPYWEVYYEGIDKFGNKHIRIKEEQ